MCDDVTFFLEVRHMATNRIAPRYGISEWFGKDISSLNARGRRQFSNVALADNSDANPNCPFVSEWFSDDQCNKKGGVCSIRKFNATPEGGGSAVPDDLVVTVCPLRFINNDVFSWVSRVMLGTENAIKVKETPFLRSTSEDSDFKAGRIDWILVDPRTLDMPDPSWCALETQSVYFSGENMGVEFQAYSEEPGMVLFPVGKRRPDYRSNGPKRLSPQLDVKVPVLRGWGKKVAVLVDRFFFSNMGEMQDVFARARNDQERLDNSEVVWFIVDYDAEMKMIPFRVAYSTLDASRSALNATQPLGKTEFTDGLRDVIRTGERGKKIFDAP